MNKDPSPASSPDELWEALARYVSGESPPEEAERIRRWLAEQPARADLMTALADAIGRLPAAASADVDVEAALRRVKARFDETQVYRLPPRLPAEEQSSHRWRRTLVRVAAAVIVVLGASLIWRASQDREVPLVATAAYATSVGQTDSLRLPDGTRVVLGPLSRLTLSGDFGNSTRAVELNGEAWFDVEPDARTPFTVRAGAATIRDLGTGFAVRSNGGLVRVAVTVGSVVLHATGRPESTGVVLEAGDRGVLAASGGVSRERGAADDNDIAFTQGRLVFENATLEEVATELRRWFGIELRASDPVLANRHLTAAFEGDSLAQVLNVIGLAFGASIERKGDTAFVRIPH